MVRARRRYRLGLSILGACLVAVAACSRQVTPAEPAAEVPPGAVPSEGRVEAAGDVGKGRRVFETNCIYCHGTDGRGGPGGGASLVEITDPAVVVRTVDSGRGYTMPSFAGLLSDDEIKDVSAYVTQRLAR